MKNEFEIIGKCLLCGGDVTKRDIDWDMNGGSHFAWCGKCRLRSARATMHETNEHLMELYYEACQRRKKKLLEKEILSKVMVIIDGNEIETKGLFTNWELTYVKEPLRNKELNIEHLSECPKTIETVCKYCNKEFRYSIYDIMHTNICEPIRSNEMISLFDEKAQMEKYKDIHYLECPYCKGEIMIEITGDIN